MNEQAVPLVLVSNRGPVTFDADGQTQRGSGGVVTALMKFAPGAVLPDHEHVKIEQTYVLEGKLVDKEGPAKDLTVGPGEFVWREAGSRHVACTPEGGLMLAMFQGQIRHLISL